MMDPHHVRAPGPGEALAEFNSHEEMRRCWAAKEQLEKAYRTCGGQLPMQTKVGMARQVLTCRVAVEQRYRMIDLPDIARKNEHHGDQRFTRMLTAFDMLEKYAFNLLKPVDKRPKSWRWIQFGNSVFVNQVDSVFGTRDILSMMGYSILTEHGLEFSPNMAEPNYQQVAELAADLILARVELDMVKKQLHPNLRDFFSAVQGRRSVSQTQPQLYDNQSLPYQHGEMPANQAMRDLPPEGSSHYGLHGMRQQMPGPDQQRAQGMFQHSQMHDTFPDRQAAVGMHDRTPQTADRRQVPAGQGYFEEGHQRRHSDAQSHQRNGLYGHRQQEWDRNADTRGAMVHDKPSYPMAEDQFGHSYQKAGGGGRGLSLPSSADWRHPPGDVMMGPRAHGDMSGRAAAGPGGNGFTNPGTTGGVMGPGQQCRIPEASGPATRYPVGAGNHERSTVEPGLEGPPGGGMVEQGYPRRGIMSPGHDKHAMMGQGPQGPGEMGQNYQGHGMANPSGQVNLMAPHDRPGVMATGAQDSRMGTHGGTAGMYSHEHDPRFGKEQGAFGWQPPQEPGQTGSSKRYSSADMDQASQAVVTQGGDYLRHPSVGSGHQGGTSPAHGSAGYGEEVPMGQHRSGSGLVRHVDRVPFGQAHADWQSEQHLAANNAYQQKEFFHAPLGHHGHQDHAARMVEGRQERAPVHDRHQGQWDQRQSQSSEMPQQQRLSQGSFHEEFEPYSKRHSTDERPHSELLGVLSDDSDATFHTAQTSPSNSRNNSGYLANSGSHNNSGYVTHAQQGSSFAQHSTNEPSTPARTWGQRNTTSIPIQIHPEGGQGRGMQPVTTPTRLHGRGRGPSLPVTSSELSASSANWPQRPSPNSTGFCSPPAVKPGPPQVMEQISSGSTDSATNAAQSRLVSESQTFLPEDLPMTRHSETRQVQCNPTMANSNPTFSQGNQRHSGEQPSVLKKPLEAKCEGILCDVCQDNEKVLHCYDCSTYQSFCESCDLIFHKKRFHHRVWPDGTPVNASVMQTYPGPSPSSTASAPRPVPKARTLNRGTSDPTTAASRQAEHPSRYHSEEDALLGSQHNNGNKFAQQSADGSVAETHDGQARGHGEFQRQVRLEHDEPQGTSQHGEMQVEAAFHPSHQLRRRQQAESTNGQGLPAHHVQSRFSGEDGGVRVRSPPMKLLGEQLVNERDDFSAMAMGPTPEEVKYRQDMKDLESKRFDEARRKEEAREKFHQKQQAAEREQQEHERQERERREHERREHERREHEQREHERREHERQEREQWEREQRERERREHEWQERKRQERERQEHEWQERERQELRRLEWEHDQRGQADADGESSERPRAPTAKPRMKHSSSDESRQTGPSSRLSGLPHPTLSADANSYALPPDINNLPSPEVQELDIRLQKLQLDFAAAGKMVHWLKDAEMTSNHTADEVNVACRLMVEEKGTAIREHPLRWIQENWPRRIQLVQMRAAALSPFLEEVSKEEAVEGLRLTPAEIETAAQHVIQERQKKATAIQKGSGFEMRQILHALTAEGGCQRAALVRLQKEITREWVVAVWKKQGKQDPPAVAKEKEVEDQRRIRVLRMEYGLSFVRAENLLKLMDMEEDFEFTDALRAVKECSRLSQALSYLKVKCPICWGEYPRPKVLTPPFCTCNLCEDCAACNFKTVVKEKNILELTCPNCSEPNLNDPDSTWDTTMYFNLTEQMVLGLVDRGLLEQNIFELYSTKVRDYGLQQMDTFIWCPHCQNGFDNPVAERYCVTCPYCHNEACFKCRIKWEPQHKGITCEQFRKWQRENDPEFQAQGLAAHLEQNGITCPQCKFRYELARGACMHFKCTQCRHEFCSGCSMPFLRSEQCRRFESCKSKGIHAHCPRDCLSFLRDSDIEWMQQLLRTANVDYLVDPPEGVAAQEAEGDGDEQAAAAADGCPLKEQKDDGTDAVCGKEVAEHNAGLCWKHYKEYLVDLINRYALDPALLMDAHGLQQVIRRDGKDIPEKEQRESEGAYRDRLREYVTKNIPLQRKRAEGAELPQAAEGGAAAAN